MNLEETFLTDPKQIKAWFDSVDVRGWSINADGLVDVGGTVHLGGKLGPLTKLPVRFGKVGGGFNCEFNRLVSLEGAPKEVGNSFYCHHNQLVNMEGSPERVGRNFWCSQNQLVSLEGAPKVVGKDFSCEGNQLASLKGAPLRVDGDFYCENNQLVSLEGAPKEVNGHFWCDHNLLVDFKGMEGVSIIGQLFVTDSDEAGQDNVFVSLEGLSKELYSKVEGLDVQVVLELEKKRAASLSGNKVNEDLSSELELG